MIRVLHHDTKWVERWINEDFFVLDYIRVPDTCQYPDLIDGIGPLTIVQLTDLHLFQRVVLFVSFTNDMIDTWVSTLT